MHQILHDLINGKMNFRKLILWLFAIWMLICFSLIGFQMVCVGVNLRVITDNLAAVSGDLSKATNYVSDHLQKNPIDVLPDKHNFQEK